MNYLLYEKIPLLCYNLHVSMCLQNLYVFIMNNSKEIFLKIPRNFPFATLKCKLSILFYQQTTSKTTHPIKTHLYQRYWLFVVVACYSTTACNRVMIESATIHNKSNIHVLHQSIFFVSFEIMLMSHNYVVCSKHRLLGTFVNIMALLPCSQYNRTTLDSTCQWLESWNHQDHNLILPQVTTSLL